MLHLTTNSVTPVVIAGSRTAPSRPMCRLRTSLFVVGARHPVAGASSRYVVLHPPIADPHVRALQLDPPSRWDFTTLCVCGRALRAHNRLQATTLGQGPFTSYVQPSSLPVLLYSVLARARSDPAPAQLTTSHPLAPMRDAASSAADIAAMDPIPRYWGLRAASFF